MIMTSEMICIIFATILAFSVLSICLIHLYRREHKRANIFEEYIEIKRQIEKGNRADKIFWKYYDVTYLNDTYNIKIKNLKQKRASLEKQ